MTNTPNPRGIPLSYKLSTLQKLLIRFEPHIKEVPLVAFYQFRFNNAIMWINFPVTQDFTEEDAIDIIQNNHELLLYGNYGIEEHGYMGDLYTVTLAIDLGKIRTKKYHEEATVTQVLNAFKEIWETAYKIPENERIEDFQPGNSLNSSIQEIVENQHRLFSIIWIDGEQLDSGGFFEPFPSNIGIITSAKRKSDTNASVAVEDISTFLRYDERLAYGLTNLFPELLFDFPLWYKGIPCLIRAYTTEIQRRQIDLCEGGQDITTIIEDIAQIRE